MRRLMEAVDRLMETKLIAYHGTGARFDQFHQSSLTPLYFTTDKDYASGYTGKVRRVSPFEKPTKRGRDYLLTVELDIKHMFDPMNDPVALDIYNNHFRARINAIYARYKKPLVPELAPGQHVSFIYSDDLYRYLSRGGDDHEYPYDGMLVDEGFATASGQVIAVVAFNASQIKILKRQIIKSPKSQPAPSDESST